MAVQKLDEIFEIIKGRPKQTLVAAYSNDEHTISAVSEAIDAGFINGVLVGDRDAIKGICGQIQIDYKKFSIVHQPIDHVAAAYSVDLINKGEGDVIMKGLVSTDKFMRAILDKEKGLLSPGAILSHVVVMESPHYHKLIVASDVAVIPHPSLKQKIILIDYIVSVARSLGISEPKVAAIAPTERVLPAINSCVEAAVLSRMNDRRQIKGCVLDGPLAIDVAIDVEAARIKGLGGSVVGDADCLLFPNIEAGNVFYKTNTKLAGAKSAAVLVGAKAPAVLTSRGDSIQSKLYSIALAVLRAGERQGCGS